MEEFRLDDPYMREVNYPYEAVHDPGLRRMFQVPEWHNLLLSRGFILPTEEAVCSLRQFNAYRRYLHTVYRDVLRQEYRKRVSLTSARRRIDVACRKFVVLRCILASSSSLKNSVKVKSAMLRVEPYIKVGTRSG